MKKILSLFLVMMMFALNAMAGESKTSKSSQSIMLEIAQYNETSGRARAPMRIGIEAWYNADSNTIDITYDGEAEGEVFLYLNEDIVEVCYREIVRKYGTDKWYYPDVNCPFAQQHNS